MTEKENNSAATDAGMVNAPQWMFRAVASFSSSATQTSDAISSIDFSPDGSLFATAGIAKKIRFYGFGKTLVDPTAKKKSKFCVTDEAAGLHKIDEIYTPAKLSSVAWCPADDNVICCGDYDGVVTEWDVHRGIAAVERYDHGGRRVWSVDYSRFDPGLCASASADGTVRLWTARTDTINAIIKPSATGASVCSAHFSSFCPNFLAAASADGGFYLYDLRKTQKCLLGSRGHARAVSYVRFLDNGRLVSASIDNTVNVWDISSGNEARLVRKWEGQHLNVKNFVGLSVSDRRGELIACGSETNELFVYHSDDERSLWRSAKFPSTEATGSFIGAVCWRRGQSDGAHSAVAANSDGSLQLIQATILV